MDANHSEPLLKSQREPLLQLSDLTVDFDTSEGWVRCLYGVDMEVYSGEILGLVGESGSGKSMTALAVMGLLPHGSHPLGGIELDGVDVLGTSEPNLCKMRGNTMGMVFQEPMTALNPFFTIGRQLREPLLLHMNMTK